MRAKDALYGCLESIAARLSAQGSLACGDFAAELRSIRRARPDAPEVPTTGLPVLRHWPAAVTQAAAIDRGLAAALQELSPSLVWRQNPNYVRLPPSPDFLAGYGYAVIAGPGGVVPARIALGVLLLAPGLIYPAHAHPAEEIYVVLDGASRWQRAGEPWREGIGGAAIHHPPHVAHAMQAGAAPLCAMYLWRGDLATNAALTG